MSAQLELFNQPKVRHSDGDTSRDAAAVVSRVAARLEGVITDTVRMLGSATDDEICAELSYLHPPTVKTARSRSSKRGLLVDSGERRPSVRGRAQIVWTTP